MPSLHPRRSSKNYFEDKAKYLRWSEKTKYFHCNNGTKKELARSRGVRTKWDIATIIIGNNLVCENIKKNPFLEEWEKELYTVAFYLWHRMEAQKTQMQNPAS